MEKSTGFGDLVRNSGRPHVVTLWTAPRKDRGFARAMKENRVLTVVEPDSRRAYGIIGFEQHPHATYLVFPRPLQGTGRVIGINYQLLEEPVVTDAVRVARNGVFNR